MKFPSRGFWVRTGLVLVLAFVAMQFVPYGRDHMNPPVAAEPRWDSPETRALAKQACFDCHSNETEWPAYSNVAPVSWLIRSDVSRGRRHLNLSKWSEYSLLRKERSLSEMANQVKDHEMPLRQYTLLHPKARLSESEVNAIFRWTQVERSRLIVENQR